MCKRFYILHTHWLYLPKCLFCSHHLNLKICLVLAYCQQNGKKLSKNHFAYSLMNSVGSEKSMIELEPCLKKTSWADIPDSFSEDVIVSFLIPFSWYWEEQGNPISLHSYDITLLVRKCYGQGSCWDLSVCTGVRQGVCDQMERTWKSEGKRDAVVCRQMCWCWLSSGGEDLIPYSVLLWCFGGFVYKRGGKSINNSAQWFLPSAVAFLVKKVACGLKEKPNVCSRVYKWTKGKHLEKSIEKRKLVLNVFSWSFSLRYFKSGMKASQVVL